MERAMACYLPRRRTCNADVEQRVQAAGAHERGVEQVRPVGGADHEKITCAGTCMGTRTDLS